MVVVPAGSFTMGSNESEQYRPPISETAKRKGLDREYNREAKHAVAIARPFAIGKFEVTFQQWDQCVSENGCTHKADDVGWGRNRRPVINVSYGDAKEFVAWLSKKTGKAYRLLSEAEWEYSARALVKFTPTPPPFSTGPTIGFQQANYDANFTYAKGNGGLYRQKTVDVGTLPKNAFGLHEMHGNVWEWVEDCYKDSYAGAPTDGSPVVEASCDMRILRGGSWNYQPHALRSAYRFATWPDLRVNMAGFRIARSL